MPITVRAQANRRHRFGASLGYGTDTEVRGKFTWDNRRVNADGHRFKLELLGSAIVKEISGRYAIPVMDVALEKLEFFGALQGRRARRHAQRARRDQYRPHAGPGTAGSACCSALLERDHDRGRTGQVEHRLYVYPGISYSTLPSYIVGGKRRPYFIYAELRGSPSTFGSDSSFLQFRSAGGAHLRPLRPVAPAPARRARRDSLDEDSQNLPASQRFFAGGERSVRGFSLNELSPKDTEGRSVGGRHLATGSIEFERDLPKNFGVATFFDIGNAFDDFSDPRLEYSVGVGVRYKVAVASFGIDVAQALSESGRTPKLHLYILTQFDAQAPPHRRRDRNPAAAGGRARHPVLHGNRREPARRPAVAPGAARRPYRRSLRHPVRTAQGGTLRAGYPAGPRGGARRRRQPRAARAVPADDSTRLADRDRCGSHPAAHRYAGVRSAAEICAAVPAHRRTGRRFQARALRPRERHGSGGKSRTRQDHDHVATAARPALQRRG